MHDICCSAMWLNNSCDVSHSNGMIFIDMGSRCIIPIRFFYTFISTLLSVYCCRVLETVREVIITVCKQWVLLVLIPRTKFCDVAINGWLISYITSMSTKQQQFACVVTIIPGYQTALQLCGMYHYSLHISCVDTESWWNINMDKTVKIFMATHIT